jgi:''chromo'' (CHRromatin Organisation MOdifier) domain./Integrase core domain.
MTSKWFTFLEDNTVADALSRVAPAAFPQEGHIEPHVQWSTLAASVLSISTDTSVLKSILSGYQEDEFCKKLSSTPIPGTRNVNGLWYISDRLVIPRTADLRENLFRLAHDTSGHFGADKAYEALRHSYYWPNMRRDLEEAYIPSCDECQRNKSRTTKPAGPLHPLPVPDNRGESVALDFVGPLPEDDGYNCILTMTDRLGGSDIRIIPTRTDLTAEQLAVLFFDNWYCENGLPLELISDRDKLFVSRFWKALSALTGVKLKLSTAYHPQTDGSSERSNKTVNQTLRFHVRRNQKGWVKALPRIRFDIMNSVNASTGFSPFVLRLGRSPRIIPPIVPTSLPTELIDALEALSAQSIIERMEMDTAEAKDNLLRAKVTQAYHANKARGPEEVYAVDDKVMLSTVHRRNEYKKKGEKRVAKFFPRFDGPYTVIEAYPTTSTYKLDMPTKNIFPVFHSSELKRYHTNDPLLFPGRTRTPPGPVVTPDGLEEFFIQEIIDSRRRGKGWQFLVRWTGYGPEHDAWLPTKSLEDCEALDRWYENGGDGPAGER